MWKYLQEIPKEYQVKGKKKKHMRRREKKGKILENNKY